MSDARRALLRLARAEGVGPVTYRRLLARFGDAEEALAALPALAGTRSGPAPRIPTDDAIAAEMDALARLGGTFLLLDEPLYPAALACLDAAPPALAVLGDPALLGAPMVAIVGARNASGNGRRFAEALATELTLAGLVVVSGLARGIDAAAHRGALPSGLTAAVIAGGLDRPYPPENAALQEAIVAAGGVVVAEQKLGVEPTSRHFPRRNRIVAGLARATIVVEAARHSGSLITARHALEYGRELFAVPASPLDPRGRGSNQLLRRGEAHFCEDAADVLAELGPALRAPRRGNAASARRPIVERPVPKPGPEPGPDAFLGPAGIADAVLGLLDPTPVPIDDLVRRCQFSASAVSAALAELELAGRVETLPGARVCLRLG